MPAVMLVLGVTVISVAKHNSLLEGAGIALACYAPVTAIQIKIRRAINL